MAHTRKSTRNKTWAMAVCSVCSLAAFWAGMRVATIVAATGDPLGYLSEADAGTLAISALASPLDLSHDPSCLLAALLCFCAVWWVYAMSFSGKEEVRNDDAHGSARFGSVKEGRVFRDNHDPDNNIVLTKHLGLAIRPNEHVQRKVESLNVLIIGGTGTNKTTGYVMPNILQLHSNRDLVVVDPKGTTLTTCGHALVAAGIDITVLNTVDPARSDHYNPLAYIRSYHDITSFVTNFVNCTNKGHESKEPIWDNGEMMVLSAILTLLFDWFDRSSMNMANVIALAGMVGTDESGVPRGPLALIFEQIEHGVKWVAESEQEEAGPVGAFEVVGPRRPRGQWVPSLLRRRDGVAPALETRADGTHGIDDDQALRAWKAFLESPQNTRQSFLISLNARLNHLRTPEVLELLAASDGVDEMRLDRLGRPLESSGIARPRVLFVIASDHDASLSPLLSLFCWQTVHVLCSEADATGSGHLSRPVTLMFDEFKNIGRIENFDNYLNTMRSRHVSLQLLVQSTEQLSALYAGEGKVIADACTTQVFLGGGRNAASAKGISEALGQETILTRSSSTQGAGLAATFGDSVSSTGRALITPDELERLGEREALVRISNMHPIIDAKSFVWEHPAYEEAYMGLDHERSFDYRCWRESGRPFDEPFARWEERYVAEVIPILRVRNKLREQLGRTDGGNGCEGAANELTRRNLTRLAAVERALERARAQVAATTRAELAGEDADARSLVSSGPAAQAYAKPHQQAS